MPERVVLVGYGPVGARFVEELLPAVRSGSIELTVVGAETADAYNRVLIADYAVGHADRDALEITDTSAAREAGVTIHTGSIVTSINRTLHTVSLGNPARGLASELPYDRLVLATGARANVPTLAGVTRVRRDRMRPGPLAELLDSSEAALPRGITVLRDLDDAQRVLEAVRAGSRIIVLGAGVLGMELALAAAKAGAEACIVYNGETPMARNLDRGGGTVLARSARRAGVSMVNHSRAESVVFHLDDDGIDRFDALVCADGKQIFGDLLVLSCGVGARTELAALAGLAVSSGVLVDDSLRSHTDGDVYAIGDCAHVAPRRREGDAAGVPEGGPSGLIGPGWRQADWLAARFAAEVAVIADVAGAVDPAIAANSAAVTGPAAPYLERAASVVMLKAEGVDVAAAGAVDADPFDAAPFDAAPLDTAAETHAAACATAPLTAPLSVAQWIDAEHGRYVKLVTRSGILEGFVCVGMPRTAAELTLLFERRSELPADRSMLLRFDGPDYDASSAGDAFALEATVCWCNGVTVGAIADSAGIGNTTIACIGAATRAGTGCGGCKSRIGDVLERFSAAV